MMAFVLNPLKRIDCRALIISILFSLFVIVLERVCLKVNYGQYISHLSNKEFDRFTVIAYAVLIFSWFSFFAFTYISLVSSRRYKIVYFALFAFAVFHEYGYQNAYGRFSEIIDLTIASATTTEQKINTIIIYFNPLAIIPCIGFLFVLLTQKSKTTAHGLKSLIALFVLSVSISSGVWYVLPRLWVDGFPTASLGACSNTFVGYFLFNTFSYKKEREKVDQPVLAENYTPKNNIVFVLDESIRGDHLSLNGYERETTPYLDELSKRSLIKNWGIAASASTCSITSHNLLITGLKTEEMPDKDEMVKKVPSIFEYAKAMKYKTYYFDGQMNTFWGGTKDDLSYIDVWKNNASFNNGDNWRWSVDFNIAKKIKEITETSTGNFIFIFKHGNHTPYNRNFPESEATWKPSFTGWRPNFSGIEYKVSSEEMIAFINSYDNAIKYNLDNFFKNLATDYSNLPNNTVIIYTSDHAQTLSEGGLTYSHCGNNPKEAIVPLFTIGNIGRDVDTGYKASHANLFATLLDLMNYPEQFRKRDYAISLLKAKASDSKERYFVGANLSHGIKIKFD